MRKFFLFVVLSVLLLTGCDINKSAKLAFPIEGLSYETASQSGVTDKEGAFVYAPQETEVTFSLGELALATLPITEVITLEQFFHLDSFPEGNEINGEVLHSEEMEGTTAFLTLLYVLDEDNNISNGVKINTEVAKLVKDLDLTQGYRKLLSDFDFLTLLATIEVNKALPRTAYIPNITLVLTEFYAALGLNSPYSVVLEDGTFEKKNYSYNTLGLLLEKTVLNIDANRTYRYRYTYNALGLQTLYEYDGDISTIESDTVRKYRYDAFGNRIEELYNDRNTTKIYDENLQVIESHRDDDNDGTIDSKYYIERDEQGNIVKTRSDSGNNGSIEREEQYVYDEEGREVSKTTTSNGSVEIRTYQYGSEGYLTKEVERKDGNLTSEITFNVQGQKLTVWSDPDGDGVPSRQAFHTYDARNNLIKLEESTSPDGNITFVQTKTYNSDNQVLTRESHGTSLNSKYTYVYDEKGNNIEWSYTNFDNSTKNYVHYYRYDEKGNRVYAYRIREGNPTHVFIVKSIFDDNSNKIKEEKDNDGDGVFEKVIEWQYTLNGGWDFYFRGNT